MGVAAGHDDGQTRSALHGHAGSDARQIADRAAHRCFDGAACDHFVEAPHRYGGLFHRAAQLSLLGTDVLERRLLFGTRRTSFCRGPSDRGRGSLRLGTTLRGRGTRAGERTF
jgi:hypothetical protein